MNEIPKLIIRWLIPVLGAAIALGIVFYLYRGLDQAAFLASLQTARLGWIAVLAATILLEQFVQGWKWRQLLHDVKPVSAARLTGALLAGYGANVLVPLGISPLVRSWLIARLENLKIATVFVTTMISRFVDGVVFALIAGLVAAAGQTPQIAGSLRLGLIVAGMLNFALFAGLLFMLFRYRSVFGNDAALICRIIDRAARLVRKEGKPLRATFSDGIVWPGNPLRRLAIIAASIAMKIIATTHFLWAGLAVGVSLGPFDYLFLLVFAGFSLVLARFVRIPGGFVIGSAFALQLLGVANEPALAMILFVHIVTIVLVVGLGLVILWQSGIDIRAMSREKRLAGQGA